MKRFLGKLVLAIIQILFLVAIAPIFIIILIVSPIYGLIDWSIREARK